MKKEIERILYKNYEPVKGLGADEIDIAIDQILELFAQEKEKLLEDLEDWSLGIYGTLKSEREKRPIKLLWEKLKNLKKK